MVKICRKCGEEKDISQFNVDKRSPDGHHRWCKSCVNANRKKKYWENVETSRKRSLQDYAKSREIVDSLKRPCEKCGESRPWVIQFHHRDPSTKRFNVAHGVHGEKSIIEEVKKCVCLCSNCHDEFHYFYGNNPENPTEALIKYLGGS